MMKMLISLDDNKTGTNCASLSTSACTYSNKHAYTLVRSHTYTEVISTPKGVFVHAHCNKMHSEVNVKGMDYSNKRKSQLDLVR